MLRASACLAAIGLVFLSLTGIASAAPTVKLKAVIVPIKGYPDTGNIAGAGAALDVEYAISGTEYAGSPPPLIGINFYLPAGSQLDSKAFSSCPEATILERREPRDCPQGSNASPAGSAERTDGRVFGVVQLGAERVPEEFELFAFLKPGGGLELLADGHSPVTLEIPSSGFFLHLNGGGGFGPEFVNPVPLVAIVAGAPDASVERLELEIGPARGPRNPKKAVYYGRAPKKCPKGFLVMKTEVTFAEDGDESKPEVVPAEYHAPCPKGSTRSGEPHVRVPPTGSAIA